ncbi:MAG: hypothetical protein WBM61_10910 [Woeseiaceae bacterium]
MRSEVGCSPATGAVLQVLDSGGPIADDGRASSSYLVWVDGVARVLIDTGGGAFLCFGETDADFVEKSSTRMSIWFVHDTRARLSSPRT